MHSFTTFFLCALAACVLQGSFAKDPSGYICLIEDPKQNQCDSICLTELSPQLNEVVKAQNNGNMNTRKSVNEVKSKLETLEVKIGEAQAKLPQEVHAKLEGRLQGVENKLEGRLQGVENKLEGRLQGLERQLQEGQTKMEAKLGERLLAVQGKIENQLRAGFNKIETELQAVLKDINVGKMEIPDRISNNIPSGFELIGTRYFRIVQINVDWDTAERRCREMGGYLAAFRNEQEFNAIKEKIGSYAHWIGINDRDNEGHFVSVASHKPAPFLKWYKGDPSDRNHKFNCVYLDDYGMREYECNYDTHFICQADNET